jgi:hypothetical protein
LAEYTKEDLDILAEDHIMIKWTDMPTMFCPVCFTCNERIDSTDGPKYVTLAIPEQVLISMHENCFAHLTEAFNNFERTFIEHEQFQIGGRMN